MNSFDFAVQGNCFEVRQSMAAPMILASKSFLIPGGVPFAFAGGNANLCKLTKTK